MTSSIRYGGARRSKHRLQKSDSATLQKESYNGTEGTKASLLEWQCVDFMQAEKIKELSKQLPPIFLPNCIKDAELHASIVQNIA